MFRLLFCLVKCYFHFLCSGETEDTFIADLSVGLATVFLCFFINQLYSVIVLVSSAPGWH